ncbi:hypothetical protein HY989_04495 [Candidatus Micrarchaeota archaeon]|nr:hypothetical protein [Candidatus Micrarchaeota archaeon]
MDLLMMFASYGIGGALLSEIDRRQDELKNKSELFTILLAVINSLLLSYLVLTDASSAILFAAVLIGVIFGGKVDNLPFLLGSLILGGAILFRVIYQNFSYAIPLVFALAISALLDEYGHDRSKKYKTRLIGPFFEHRMTLKTSILVLSVVKVISVWHFLAFLIFDIAYELNSKRVG